MADKDSETYKNWLAQVSSTDHLTPETNRTIKSFLQLKVDFISLIMEELLEQEKTTHEKHFTPYPKYIKDVSEKDLVRFVAEVLSEKKYPTTPFEILEQLAAIRSFYSCLSKSEDSPPLRLLMEVDLLAQYAIHSCGCANVLPKKVDEYFRQEKSKRKTKIKKEIWAGIILKAAKRKNILPGKIPRVEQLRIHREIEIMIDEGALSDKELSSLKDKKPPSIDTIKERMLEAANAKNKKT